MQTVDTDWKRLPLSFSLTLSNKMVIVQVGTNYVGLTINDRQTLVKTINKAYIFPNGVAARGYVRKYLKGKNVNFITL